MLLGEVLLPVAASLDRPDHLYNWLVNFFGSGKQCITYFEESPHYITLFQQYIVQGSINQSIYFNIQKFQKWTMLTH